MLSVCDSYNSYTVISAQPMVYLPIILEKRRVEELLYEDIGKEEVAQLSNGRYVCKLCSHKPIFDTLRMFYVHKQGKKHQSSVEYCAAEQQDLEDLIVKRTHENMAKRETLDYQADYQGCETREEMMKRKTGKKNAYCRKSVVDLNASSSSQGHASVSIASTQISQLPGNRNLSHNKPDKCSGEQGMTRSFTGLQTGLVHVDKEKNNLEKQRTSQFENQHCKSQHCKSSSGTKSEGEIVIKPDGIGKLVGLSDSQKRNMFYLSRKKQKQETTSAVGNSKVEHFTSALKAPEQTWEHYKNSKGPSNVQHGVSKAKKPGKSESDKLQIQFSCQSIDAGKQERAEKFLKAFGSGWKKDRDGSWIKDENVEFDSDEEAPDVS